MSNPTDDNNPSQPAQRLIQALRHACERLNAIPHGYQDTDFALICEAIAEAERIQDPRVLVLLQGGLVQDVLANRPGIEVAVLDLDIEGMEDEDLADVTGDGFELRGSLNVQETTGAPDLIESVWQAREPEHPCADVPG